MIDRQIAVSVEGFGAGCFDSDRFRQTSPIGMPATWLLVCPCHCTVWRAFGVSLIHYIYVQGFIDCLDFNNIETGSKILPQACLNDAS